MEADTVNKKGLKRGLFSLDLCFVFFGGLSSNMACVVTFAVGDQRMPSTLLNIN